MLKRLFSFIAGLLHILAGCMIVDVSVSYLRVFGADFTIISMIPVGALIVAQGFRYLVYSVGKVELKPDQKNMRFEFAHATLVVVGALLLAMTSYTSSRQYHFLKQYEKSNIVLEYLLPVNRIVFGSKSIPVENNLLCQAGNYMAMHQWEKAEPALKEKLALVNSRLGADNFYTILVKEDLSKVYFEQDKNLNEALSMMNEVVKIKTKTNNKDLNASIRLRERIKAKSDQPKQKTSKV